MTDKNRSIQEIISCLELNILMKLKSIKKQFLRKHVSIFQEKKKPGLELFSHAML